MKAVAQIVNRPIDDLKEWPGNPRHNDHAVQPLADSIDRYGMNVPVLINSEGLIIAGNTRWKAMKLLRENGKIPADATIPCVVADHLTPDQQKAFNIADNKLASLSHWNDDLLKVAIDELQAVGIDGTDLGFSPAELEILSNGWAANTARAEGMEETDAAAPARIVIECNANDEQEIREFIQMKLKETSFVDVIFK